MSWGERGFLLILVELLTITQWDKVRGDFFYIGGIAIPPISTKITSYLNSLSDGQQFHQYQQKSPLTWTHWMMLRWHVIFVDIGRIVDHHSMSLGEKWFWLILVELLTITQWVEVRGDFCWYWWNCWHIEWWSTIPPISTKITFHLNSLSDGQQFHRYQQKSHLTSTHWVMSTIPPISTKITSHFNSLSDSQQFHQNQPESPLTLTHWVMVNNSTNINKNHFSPPQWV
jgi:hypothetical protein